MSRIQKKNLAAASVLAVWLALGPASPAAEATGWQVDLKYGTSSFEQQFEGPRDPVFDDESEAAGVDIGYGFNRYIGVQAGYQDLGTFQGTGSFCLNIDRECRERLALYAPVPFEAELSGWSLAVVPSWPFTDRFSAYGKLGFLDWEADVAPAPGLAGLIGSESFSDRDVLAALGLRYRFGKNFGALIEYQRLDLELADLASSSVGVSWTF